MSIVFGSNLCEKSHTRRYWCKILGFFPNSSLACKSILNFIKDEKYLDANECCDDFNRVMEDNFELSRCELNILIEKYQIIEKFDLWDYTIGKLNFEQEST